MRDGVLDRSLLGRRLDHECAAELAACGIDVCGERGEYHTVVTNGPLFARPIRLATSGQMKLDDCPLLLTECA